MSIKVPEAIKETFPKYLALSTESRKALISSLNVAPAALTPGKLAAHISPKVKSTETKAGDISKLIFMLTSMYSAREAFEIPIKNFVDEIFDTQNKQIEELKLSKAVISSLRKDLVSLLSSKKALDISSKASSVLQQHEHVYRDARVLTDIRPVFGSDATKEPEAAVLVHMLKLMYSDGENYKEFFVALDSNDIDELQELLKRARTKESSLRKILKKSKVDCIEVS